MSEPASTARCGYVALVGWTNVGKSTLLNRLVGEKIAAVSDAAQTTRHRITGVRTLSGRGQLIFLDTPGFHKPRHRLNRRMVEIARESLRGVDVALHVVDAARGLGAGDAEVAALVARSGATHLVALNKIDRVRPKSRLLPLMESAARDWNAVETLALSALTGEGCQELPERLLSYLPVGPALYPDDALTDQPERVIAAELVREQLLHRLRAELPHSTAVLIERWEASERLVTIHAVVLIERESQKAIVIGAGGALLKDVGTQARAKLETLLGRQVMLHLWVRVRQGWRDDSGTLAELGI